MIVAYDVLDASAAKENLFQDREQMFRLPPLGSWQVLWLFRQDSSGAAQPHRGQKATYQAREEAGFSRLLSQMTRFELRWKEDRWTVSM